MMTKSLIEHSKIHYVSISDRPTCEEISTGALQRIADASELMAKNHEKMERDLNYLKERHRENLARISKLERSNAALKGVITRLKNAKDER